MKPNILLLTADQQRHDTIGGVNAPFMKTPSLDRLCREGVCYANAYSPNPVCIPARHNILTGLPGRYHGLPNNVHRPLPHGLPTLPRLLSENGYATAANGKMHFHPVRAHHGFHHMRLMEEIPEHRDDDEFLQYLSGTQYKDLLHLHGVRHLGYQKPQRSLLDDSHHGSTWVAEETCRHIEANKDRPWFIWSSWIQPHPPSNVSNPFADLYCGADLPPLKGRTDETPAEHRFRELYYAAISQVDKNVGLVLEALDRLGLADNTLIIYTSDHGEMLGDLGLRTKELPYDSASRIPFIVRFPGKMKPGISNEFVDLNDILPTAIDAAGIDIVKTVQEHSIDAFPGESLISPRGTRNRGEQYAECFENAGRWIMFRDTRWKYIHFFGDGTEEFYDMENDSQEAKNIRDDASLEVQNALRTLRNKAVAHEARWGMKGSVINGKFADQNQPFDKARYALHTPAWSVMQWPSFIKNWGVETAQRMEREIHESVKLEPLGQEARKALEEHLGPIWFEEWKKRRGDPSACERIFGRKLFLIAKDRLPK